MSDATSENPSKEQEEKKEVVIYEDDEIKVLFWEGHSEKIITTFGDLISLANETRYFADTPLKKLGLSTIGFMAKRGNWFPKKSVLLASEKTLPIVSRYTKNIMYGGSMGGYAALKYSKLLQADVVISLCPQWSIDPIECNGNKSGYESYFEPSMTGMGIIKNDLAGKLFAFYDPRHSNDSFHMRNIRQLGFPIEVIHVPHSGHHITTVLAGTTPISELIEKAETGDLEGLKKAVSTARRASVKRAQMVIEKSSLRHPAMSGKLISKPLHLRKLGLQSATNVDNNILSKIDTEKYPEISLTILNRIIARNKCTIRAQFLSSLRKNIELKSYYCLSGKIKTHHETFVCYDLISAKLVHKPALEINTNSSIFKYVSPIRLTSGITTIAVMADDNAYICTLVNRESVQLKPTTEIIEHNEYITINEEDGNIRLKMPGVYACANKNGRIEVNRSSASHWENFRILQFSA